MGRRFTTVLGRLGMPTGDGRIISPGGLTSRDLPLPLSWQRESGEGHGGSVVVGRLESIEFHQDMVTATGHMLNVPDAWEAEELMDAGVIGPSMDLDDLTYVVDENDRIVITSARVAGATLVAIPAFAEVSISLDPMPVPDVSRETSPGDVYENWDTYALTASVRSSGWSDMPLADETRDWDGDAAAGRVFSWATDGDTTDWGRYARAFLRKDDDADPETKGAYSFGIADVIDGTLTIVPRGVFAAAAAVQGARTGDEPSEADAMRRVLSGIYRRLDRTPPWAEAALMASVHPYVRSYHSNAGNCECGMAEYSQVHPHAYAAALVPPGCVCSRSEDDPIHGPSALMASGNVSRETLPPLEYFTRPPEVTPVTVDGDRVSGYVATWGTCHVGLPGCTTAPASSTQYAHFLRKEQPTQDGTVVPVGVLTVGGGHADASLGLVPALAHYDDVGTAVAKVFAGEDEHGIWVAGWVLPYADPVKVQQLSDLDVSGDWRRAGGNLELIAVCAVNTPGFPVLRKVHFSLGNGGQSTLIGQFKVEAPTIVESDVSRETSADDVRARWAWANRKV